MIEKVGKWLSTIWGFWFNIIIATAAIPVATFIAYDPATFFLSWFAIVLPAFILYHGYCREKSADRRDKAMHEKLDEIIRATDKADDGLVGIEGDDDSGGNNGHGPTRT